MTLDATTFLDSINDASKGLLYPSESDFPIEAFSFGDKEPTSEALLEARGVAADTPVEETTIDSFFEGLIEAADDASEREQESARRFATLAQLLRDNLENIRVFRAGEVDIEVFVLGKHASGTWMGVRTNVVET